MSSNFGYLYCFSNPSMPGILKIGMTTRKPEDRLCEANTSNTWKPPMPYSIEMSVHVKDPHTKEKNNSYTLGALGDTNT